MGNSNQNITIETVTIVPGTATVDLTYSNGSGDVTEIEGQGAAVITYRLSSNAVSSGWSIVGFRAVNALPSDMTVSVQANAAGNALVIHDAASNSGLEDFDFLIQLANAGTVYSSADPVITNEPD